jgi:malonyl-CoA/methylmalonyl-CoA synthetase
MHFIYKDLPKDVLFTRLLKLATEKKDEIIVDDHSQDVQFSYRQIVHGTSTLLQKLQGLDKSTLKEPGKVYVAVLAPNGYEFIIAVLAVLAYGGVVVPMPTGALPEEAAYMLQQCNARFLLVSPKQKDLGVRIQDHFTIPTFTIDGQAPDEDLLPITSYTLNESMVVAEDCPSIVFFTSGTTGPPKGVLHARRTINKYARMAEAGPNDELCLIPSGAFWSVYFTKVFQMLLSGVRIEIHNFGRNYNLIWEKLREQNITKTVLSPTFWYGMMHHFLEHLAQLPKPELEEYINGVRYLRDACATGAMPSKKVKDFWKDLRDGRPLKVLYGSTETQEISICDGELDTTKVRRDLF